jgi:hypothetical protein
LTTNRETPSSALDLPGALQLPALALALQLPALALALPAPAGGLALELQALQLQLQDGYTSVSDKQKKPHPCRKPFFSLRSSKQLETSRQHSEPKSEPRSRGESQFSKPEDAVVGKG